jgi:hypothetical protein
MHACMQKRGGVLTVCCAVCACGTTAHRNGYNMVLHKYGDRLYSGLKRTLTDQLQAVARKIEASQGLPFLKELKKRWEDHIKSTQMVRDILMVRTQISPGSMHACASTMHACPPSPQTLHPLPRMAPRSTWTARTSRSR